ncbi:hypothetical protein Ddye_007369 [Dipteronia dyeriana]|uniref:Uncharacterized protein n=1 Tax=Dipteronia dyeriana TaxID=168575 RepID=A0AAE0CRL5_9ROSI|nr:hypothetical protein Ddye_007369 [Dipteronia dyeriana]
MATLSELSVWMEGGGPQLVRPNTISVMQLLVPPFRCIPSHGVLGQSARQYLGQQFYLRVYTTSTSIGDEYPIPKKAILCGRVAGCRTRPL